MPPPDCLDAATAGDLLAGRLSDERRGAAEVHVDACDACMALLVRVEQESGGRTEAPTMLEAGIGASPAQRTLAAGEKVDEFEIVRLLGRGGMGEVYLAEDTELGRQVALKVIAPEMLGSEEASHQFRHEARATAKFSHPNIVNIFTIGRHRGAPYVALEYIEGRTLRDRLREGRLPHSEALRIALAITEAVAAAHARGVWHRDLKPNNVLLGDDGRARVLDFGLAKIAGQAAATAGPRSALAVGATTSAGTPLYMAPEQWRGEASSAATDVWALGVLFFELWTGGHPILTAEERALAAVGALVARQRVTAGELAPGLDLDEAASGPVGALVRRCLVLDQAARPPAADLLAALRALADAPPAAPVESRRAAPSRARRGWPFALAAGAAGAAALGGVVYFVAAGGAPTPERFVGAAESSAPGAPVSAAPSIGPSAVESPSASSESAVAIGSAPTPSAAPRTTSAPATSGLPRAASATARASGAPSAATPSSAASASATSCAAGQRLFEGRCYKVCAGPKDCPPRTTCQYGVSAPYFCAPISF